MNRYSSLHLEPNIYECRTHVGDDSICVRAHLRPGCVAVSVLNENKPLNITNPFTLYGDTGLHVHMEMDVNHIAHNMPGQVKMLISQAAAHLYLHHIGKMFGDKPAH